MSRRQETTRTLEYLEDSAGMPSYYQAYPGRGYGMSSWYQTPARRRRQVILSLAGIGIPAIVVFSLFVQMFNQHGSSEAGNSIDRFGYDRRDLRSKTPHVERDYGAEAAERHEAVKVRSYHGADDGGVGSQQMGGHSAFVEEQEGWHITSTVLEVKAWILSFLPSEKSRAAHEYKEIHGETPVRSVVEWIRHKCKGILPGRDLKKLVKAVERHWRQLDSDVGRDGVEEWLHHERAMARNWIYRHRDWMARFGKDGSEAVDVMGRVTGDDGFGFLSSISSGAGTSSTSLALSGSTTTAHTTGISARPSSAADHTTQATGLSTSVSNSSTASNSSAGTTTTGATTPGASSISAMATVTVTSGQPYGTASVSDPSSTDEPDSSHVVHAFDSDSHNESHGVTHTSDEEEIHSDHDGSNRDYTTQPDLDSVSGDPPDGDHNHDNPAAGLSKRDGQAKAFTRGDEIRKSDAAERSDLELLARSFEEDELEARGSGAGNDPTNSKREREGPQLWKARMVAAERMVGRRNDQPTGTEDSNSQWRVPQKRDPWKMPKLGGSNKKSSVAAKSSSAAHQKPQDNGSSSGSAKSSEAAENQVPKQSSGLAVSSSSYGPTGVAAPGGYVTTDPYAQPTRTTGWDTKAYQTGGDFIQSGYNQGGGGGGGSYAYPSSISTASDGEFTPIPGSGWHTFNTDHNGGEYTDSSGTSTASDSEITPYPGSGGNGRNEDVNGGDYSDSSGTSTASDGKFAPTPGSGWHTFNADQNGGEYTDSSGTSIASDSEITPYPGSGGNSHNEDVNGGDYSDSSSASKAKPALISYAAGGGTGTEDPTMSPNDGKPSSDDSDYDSDHDSGYGSGDEENAPPKNANSGKHGTSANNGGGDKPSSNSGNEKYQATGSTGDAQDGTSVSQNSKQQPKNQQGSGKEYPEDPPDDGSGIKSRRRSSEQSARRDLDAAIEARKDPLTAPPDTHGGKEGTIVHDSAPLTPEQARLQTENFVAGRVETAESSVQAAIVALESAKNKKDSKMKKLAKSLKKAFKPLGQVYAKLRGDAAKPQTPELANPKLDTTASNGDLKNVNVPNIVVTGPDGKAQQEDKTTVASRLKRSAKLAPHVQERENAAKQSKVSVGAGVAWAFQIWEAQKRIREAMKMHKESNHDAIPQTSLEDKDMERMAQIGRNVLALAAKDGDSTTHVRARDHDSGSASDHAQVEARAPAKKPNTINAKIQAASNLIDQALKKLQHAKSAAKLKTSRAYKWLKSTMYSIVRVEWYWNHPKATKYQPQRSGSRRAEEDGEGVSSGVEQQEP